MWLLHARTLELREFYGEELFDINYAILSHTWLPKDKDGNPQEVLFQDMMEAATRETARGKSGFQKIQKCCEQALEDGLTFVWIDTCCIDKRSSAELSEAINSMYAWYSNSAICYVHLQDFSEYEGVSLRMKDCRWFKRGWTLQELVAPVTLRFFDQDWRLIRCLSFPAEASSARMLSQLSGIPERILTKEYDVRWCSVPERMAWAAERHTTRPEDIAYSLLGLFGVNMPILYGEGARDAFRRLQTEYMQRRFDSSLFTWLLTPGSGTQTHGLLAPAPKYFRCTNSWESMGLDSGSLYSWRMTNLGVAITLPLISIGDGVCLGALGCTNYSESSRLPARFGIYLQEIPYVEVKGKLYRRIRCNELARVETLEGTEIREIYVLDDSSVAYQNAANFRALLASNQLPLKGGETL